MDKTVIKRAGSHIKKYSKKISVTGWLTILCIVLVLFFFRAVKFSVTAKSVGKSIGTQIGTVTGRAIGSFTGITEGAQEGYEAGKDEVLNPEDTEEKLSNQIKEVKKLEVLVASGTYTDVLTIGGGKDNEGKLQSESEYSVDISKINYAALLAQRYNAVFTVDLGSADIKFDKDAKILCITIDQPEVEFFPVGEIEKKNEFQKDGFVFKTGSAEDGWKAALDSMEKLSQVAQKKLRENESLMKSARVSAENQLKDLVRAVSLTKPEVKIEFRGDNNNG